jgi:hypothetical protein
MDSQTSLPQWKTNEPGYGDGWQRNGGKGMDFNGMKSQRDFTLRVSHRHPPQMPGFHSLASIPLPVPFPFKDEPEIGR